MTFSLIRWNILPVGEVDISLSAFATEWSVIHRMGCPARCRVAATFTASFSIPDPRILLVFRRTGIAVRVAWFEVVVVVYVFAGLDAVGRVGLS